MRSYAVMASNRPTTSHAWFRRPIVTWRTTPACSSRGTAWFTASQLRGAAGPERSQPVSPLQFHVLHRPDELAGIDAGPAGRTGELFDPLQPAVGVRSVASDGGEPSDVPLGGHHGLAAGIRGLCALVVRTAIVESGPA